MPQININEIDQSVFRRVVDDDKVKVLVPCITSFGPVYDGAKDNAMTFTDVTAFEKIFGYTEPEYNPFPHDVSRTYIKQLINRGASVSVIRVNDGYQARFTTLRDETNDNMFPAATHTDSYKEAFKLTTTQPTDWSTNYTNYFTKTNNKYSHVTGDSAPTWAENTYYVGNDSMFKFCDQILGIEAKYTGSFGNHLLVTFTPVNSVNVNFSNQYSIVSVYNADILVDSYIEAVYSLTTSEPDDWSTNFGSYYTRTGSEGHYTYNPVTPVQEQAPTWAPDTYYNKDLETKIIKRVTGVHKLESHMVTTNPNDVNYIEDVVFDYITFKLKESARDEFTIAWSNLGNTTDDTEIINGFPIVQLKYLDDSGMSVYNTDAMLQKGYDFRFSSDLITILDTGYKTITLGQPGLTIADVNRYVCECYLSNTTNTAIVANILNVIANCYENYSDPYIYDFDFITSGGFINETFIVTEEQSAGVWVPVNVRPSAIPTTNIMAAKSDRLTNTYIPNNTTAIHVGMLKLVKSRKDCIALADVNPGWDANELPQYVEYLNESQCAVHSPWCYTADPYNNNALTLMPPSFIFLYTLLSNLINSPDSQKWFPPAGVTRATARIVVKPRYEIGSTLLNKWQNDTLARVNPIMRLKNYGYVIYGQYTSYVAIDQFTHSALESLNVRLVSNCVKKQIFNLCLKLTFEPNNSSLWFKFYDGMDKYLLFMKRNDGVYDYRIQMDESTVTTDDINELRCPGKVWINPTRTAEFFDIDFILTEAGVTFSEEGE